MITYSTNMMGPWTTNWYEENNIPYTTTLTYSRIAGRDVEIKHYQPTYAGGRIDIRGVPNEPFGSEYALPIMESESWNTLSEWLDNLTTDKLLSYAELIERFESETGHNIKWFDGGKN